jgi:hypothetical protein
MCVHACLLTCLSLSVQIAEAFKALFSKGTLQIWMAAGWVGIGGSSYKHCSINYAKNTFLESSKDNNNSLRTFFPQESLVLVYHIQRRRRIFSCLFVWLFLRYVFLCVCVCLSFLSCFMCYRLSYLLSQEVFRIPLISFDKDQPNTILTPTITDNLRSSSSLGSRIVVNMSLPPTKPTAKSKPSAKRNLTKSPFKTSPFCRLDKHTGGSGVA